MLDATQIRARCKNAVVTLQGAAANDADRDLAEFDAWAVFGVDGVVNEIRIRSG
jgi:osmotically-inducible protein OsmY